MADTLPSMIWIMGNQGDVHYQNTKVLETFGVNTISEGWGVIHYTNHISLKL
ncbi:hypothetical protein K502DRAFT_323061, partial [Neoconidiobolus thromboides FSU 785]